MKVPKERQTVLSLKVTEEARRIVEQLAARLTMRRERRHTLTDVMEEAIYLLASQEGIK